MVVRTDENIYLSKFVSTMPGHTQCSVNLFLSSRLLSLCVSGAQCFLWHPAKPQGVLGGGVSAVSECFILVSCSQKGEALVFPEPILLSWLMRNRPREGKDRPRAHSRSQAKLDKGQGLTALGEWLRFLPGRLARQERALVLVATGHRGDPRPCPWPQGP